MLVTAVVPRTPTRSRCRGFTLVEVMVVVVIVAIVAAVALPSMNASLANQRLRAAATDLVSALLLARSEAIKRGVPVQVAPLVAGDWTSGWRVATVATNEQVEKTDALGTWVEVAYAPAAIGYERSGRLTGGGSLRVEFHDPAATPGVSPRCVAVDPSGLPRLIVSACA